MFIGNL
jgi:hypothetical protein